MLTILRVHHFFKHYTIGYTVDLIFVFNYAFSTFPESVLFIYITIPHTINILNFRHNESISMKHSTDIGPLILHDQKSDWLHYIIT